VWTVNFVNGSEQSKLGYRSKGLTEWADMERVERPDPYYLMINQRWKNFSRLPILEWIEKDTTFSAEDFPGTPMPRPQNSSHLWEANIGTDWPAGRHIIEVKAMDRYGRTFLDYHTMRVVEN
jgi:hypothetical protein